MRAGFVVVAAFVATACTSSNAVVCGDRVCPEETTCIDVTYETDVRHLCASKDQTDQCSAGETSCALEGVPLAACVGGACIPVVCGDGYPDPGEACDDENTRSGDGCSSDCRSNETCNNGIVDPSKLGDDGEEPNEECDDGNFTDGDGCSSFCKAEQPTWVQVAAATGPLFGYGAAYDSDRDRIVVFGGLTAANASVTQSNVYEWSGTVWGGVSPLQRPQARAYPMMAYDAARHRTVMFGGDARSIYYPFGDTWEWDGAHWSLATTATGPRPRTQGGMVYDSARKRIVLFGGVDGNDEFDDTWEWNGTAWELVNLATHPASRHGHVMAYDPVRGVTVLAGGIATVFVDGVATTVVRSDTWEYDGTTWMQTTATLPAGLDTAHPNTSNAVGRDHLASMAFEPSTGAMLVHARSVADSTTRMFRYQASSWSSGVAAGTSGLCGTVAVTDPRRGGIIMFGGTTGSVASSSTLRWDGSSWTALKDDASRAPRAYTVAATDPVGGVTWMFGGQTGVFADSSTVVGDLRRFDGHTMRSITTVGAAPSARSLTQIAYDQKRRVLVLFGGAPQSSPLVADTWEFNGVSWSQKFPLTSPTRAGPV